MEHKADQNEHHPHEGSDARKFGGHSVEQRGLERCRRLGLTYEVLHKNEEEERRRQSVI